METDQNSDKHSLDTNHEHTDIYGIQPGKKFKWIFTILFVPFCLFAISYNIAEQENVRGESYTELGMYEDAIMQSKKAIFFDKKNVDSWDYLGYSYWMLRDYDNAINAYQKVLEIEPQNLTVIDNIALSYALKGNYRDAISVYKGLEELLLKSDKLNPRDKQKKYESTTQLITVCYEKLGEYDNAKATLLEYLKRNPNNVKIKEKLAQIEGILTKKH
jgi:tetratricopeptide (TPR) repeat protein